ncbi:ABC transporter ATP-binding protein [Sneathiella sp.]|uniref:ABC transporter ATP-binding protein n=1 Tax=Sneathiella sp. TaxID=1964365 RepID=UPI00262884B4|nr:ABC transporter ATP-binding protein [Sneathiella sp.]MDF2368189.1 ABC transporter ATP-binding protein [Sneathiella sp.]
MLDIRELSVGYTENISGRKVEILSRVNLSIAGGETLGLVGESGSGKSTLGYAIAGHLSGLEIQNGSIDTKENPRIALVQQNAGQALTPTMSIGRQLNEVLKYAQVKNRTEKAFELMEGVRLPDPKSLMKRLPHQLSGGQQQRVLIALALARNPEILVLDEPTTALDASTKETLLELLAALQKSQGFAMLIVSHDLGIIRTACAETAVMYAGAFVELGNTEKIIKGGHHPYTRALVEALPHIEERLLPNAIEGTPPKPGARPEGCAFAPRCLYAEDKCRHAVPPLAPAQDTKVACFFPLVDLRKTSTAVPEPGEGKERLLAVNNISVQFKQHGGQIFKALDDVSISLNTGETLGIIGESGSGKSTLLRCLAGLQNYSAGEMILEGAEDFDRPVEKRKRATQRRLQMVFQNPSTALNPNHTIERILEIPYALYEPKSSRSERSNAIRRELDLVRLTDQHLIKRPRELSGGELQRVALARGLIARPDLLLLDEITSALDVSVQAAVLDLLVKIQRSVGCAMILVSHDIAVMRSISHKLVVLKNGRIVEAGLTEQILSHPKEAYTQSLIKSAKAITA